MKTFLSCWLAEAPKVFEREFAGNLDLLPSIRLPEPETAITFAVTFGATGDRFLVSADRVALHALFNLNGAATNGENDERDLRMWRNVLQQIAEAAVRQFDPLGTSIASSIEAGVWVLGRPSAAYELRYGDDVMLLALTDEIKPIMEEGKQRSVSSRADSSKIAPGGIDLLLDVELEASLRFGSREMPLNAVLDLGAGDVVELDRHVSDPVDLLVGDKIVARGEVVLVNGSFGLRVLEVAEPKKCLESIRCLF